MFESEYRLFKNGLNLFLNMTINFTRAFYINNFLYLCLNKNMDYYHIIYTNNLFLNKNINKYKIT